MNLKELSRPLKVEEIEFRVGNLFKNAKGVFATILAYQEARTPMKILDEVVGPENWSLSYRQEDKSVIAKIGVKTGNEWTYKESNGTAGDVEAEKSAYSDALKRAAVVWGIGRGLYDFPLIMIPLEEEEYILEGPKPKATTRLKPQDWKWSVEYNSNGSVKTLIGMQEQKGTDPRTKLRFKYPR